MTASTGRSIGIGRGRRVPYPEPSSVAATNVGKGNQRVSKSEARVRSALHAMGLRFRKDHALALTGLRVRPDVVFPRVKVAVFIDGCYWHACPTHFKAPRTNESYWGPKIASNTERDERVNAALMGAGWIVIRAWEHENPDDVAHRIANVVRSR